MVVAVGPGAGCAEQAAKNRNVATTRPVRDRAERRSGSALTAGDCHQVQYCRDVHPVGRSSDDGRPQPAAALVRLDEPLLEEPLDEPPAEDPPDDEDPEPDPAESDDFFAAPLLAAAVAALVAPTSRRCLVAGAVGGAVLVAPARESVR